MFTKCLKFWLHGREYIRVNTSFVSILSLWLLKSSCFQTKAAAAEEEEAADTPLTARRGGSCRVRRHLNPKPSLWNGQKSSLPSSSRSSSKNWLPLHKSTPSYHTFLWKSDWVPVGLCDESDLTPKDFKRPSFMMVFYFFQALLDEENS